jgi:phage/conjugal plasmid C-4 type zinc finger TraR family protein
VGDEMDRVQAHNEDFQAFALDLNQRSREPANYTGTDCLDCGVEIPAARRAANPGCRRCVACQALHENWRPM